MITAEECGVDFEFAREVFQPYAHECKAKDCSKLIENGDTFILDENECGRFHLYCSKECSEKQVIDFPKEVIYSAPRERCCSRDCTKLLKIKEHYWVVPGWSGPACSEECATAQYNLVWGSDDGGREQTVQREIDRDWLRTKRSGRFK